MHRTPISFSHINASHPMPALEKYILYLLLSKVSDGDHPHKLYPIYFDEIKKQLPGAKEEDLDKTSSALLKKKYCIEYKDREPMEIPIFTGISYQKKEGILRFKLFHTVLPYLASLKKGYTEKQLDALFLLRSKFSKHAHSALSASWK